MQIPKDDIRKQVLQAAKGAFLAKGFKGVSMREIAETSGVGLSNIYNYFQSKDELLATVLNPLVQAFNSVLENHNSEGNITIDVFTSADYQSNLIRDFVTLIAPFRKELKLLLFASHGSSFENFRESIIESNTQTGMEYMQKMHERYPYINTNISRFFIHITTSWWVSVLEEIAAHDELSAADIERFITEYVCFSTAGWKAVMKV